MASSNEIKYGLRIDMSNNWIPETISFDDVDNYDFENKPFIECLKKEKFVHLFFDFDKIESTKEYDEVKKWLDSLSTVFGPYSLGGYSNDENMAKHTKLVFIKNSAHLVSIHVIYYETMISVEDLHAIMNFKNKKFVDYEIHPKVDTSVYNVDTRRMFRHVLSDKTFKEHGKSTITKGKILDDKLPSTQIVQIRGNEKLIEKDEWIKVFPPIRKTDVEALFEEPEALRTVFESQQSTKSSKNKKSIKLDDIEIDENVIVFDGDEMDELLSHFEPEFNIFSQTLAPIIHGPYDKEILIEHFTKWYAQREHHNGVECIGTFINSYYEFNNTNKWFFSVIKHLDVDTRDYYISKYWNRIDFSININNSDWTYENLRRKQYKRCEFGKMINDLRGIIGHVEDRWFLKKTKKGQVFVDEMKEEKMMRIMSYRKPFKSNLNITLAHIIKRYSHLLEYEDARIMAKSVDNIINFFQGFKYTESQSNDFTPLEPFLNHIKHIICRDDEEKYDYFMKWWANVFVNITVKNGSMPIIHGSQGSGKSFPIEVFCELLGVFALANVDNMDKVFGKFNSLIAKHLVINLNEPPDAGDKSRFEEIIKSKISQRLTIQESKGVDQFEVESWSNYTMTTNNPNPVRDEKGNRRFIYYPTNNEKSGDKEYFNNLCKNIQAKKQGDYNPEFMSLLLHYMRTQIDVSDFDAEVLIRKINKMTNVDYNEQLENQYRCLNCVDRYVVDNYELFVAGITLQEIPTIDGYKPNGVGKKLVHICKSERKTANEIKKLYDSNDELYGDRFIPIGVKQLTFYTLKPEKDIEDLCNLIKYVHKIDKI